MLWFRLFDRGCDRLTSELALQPRLRQHYGSSRGNIILPLTSVYVRSSRQLMPSSILFFQAGLKLTCRAAVLFSFKPATSEGAAVNE